MSDTQDQTGFMRHEAIFEMVTREDQDKETDWLFIRPIDSLLY